MRKKWMQAVVTVVGIAALSSAAAYAQGAAAQGKTNMAHGQTDAAVNLYKAFNSSTTGKGTAQTPKDAIGGMFELRQIKSSLIGYEFTYSFNPGDQSFAPQVGNCGYRCSNQPLTITAGANIIGFDWVFSKQYGNVRPFAVGGLGFTATVPSSNAYAANNVVRPTYIFGGGVDWTVSEHFGVRAQVRDNFAKAPALSVYYSPTGVYMQTLQPMGGVFYRF